MTFSPHFKSMLEGTQEHIIKLENELTSLRSRNERLEQACKEWVQWFDYIQAHQHENLVNGQTLESASDNWNSMVTPSPSIEKMKEALKENGKNEESS
jgi:hypothetical protein